MPKPLVSIYLPISRADHSWGLYVTGVGYAQVGKGQKYPAVTHPTGYLFDWELGRRLDHFALVSITGGCGIFESASQPEVAVAPGNVMMLFPGEWHRYRPVADVGWEEYWVAFNGRIPREWTDQNLLSPHKPIFRIESSRSLIPDFEKLITIAREQDPLLSPLLASHCHVIISHALIAERTNEAELPQRRAIHDAAHFLLTNVGTVDMSDLAHRYGLSYCTFRRLFSKQLGVSPGRFHRDARISEAKRLLTDTAIPLKAIAEQLYFTDQFYFMQSFKKNTGFTPGDWRRGRLK